MNNRFIEKIYTKKSIKRIRSKTLLLGSENKLDAIDFMNFRLIISMLVFFIFLLFSSYAFLLAPIFTLLTYILLEYIVLDVRIKRRVTKLESEALFFFD